MLAKVQRAAHQYKVMREQSSHPVCSAHTTVCSVCALIVQCVLCMQGVQSAGYSENITVFVVSVVY